ncbi:MAG: aldo/keto reductase [Hyphomicrobiaceae bacterium]|nr:aldo/keto reductase [Hyphomicrobiaceae bacterium]
MEQRNLGPSGLLVSAVGLGCNNFGGRIDLEASRAVVHKALDLGITLLDTADVYGDKGGSETALGEILGARRKDIVLATKFGMPMDAGRGLTGASRRYIVTAVEASLRRLKTDWIDLYQLHQPDPRTPIEETLRALDDLVRQGKVRYVGCSNMPAWQVADALWTSRHRNLASFVSCQDEYSLVVRTHESHLTPAMQHYELGLLPYFPLACGLLTGKYKRGEALPPGTRMAAAARWADKYLTEPNFLLVERLTAFAESRGHSLLELVFSWLASQPVVASVIAGATKPEQVEQNVRAAGWALTAEEIAEIDSLSAT